jgi:hypothetical protein
VTSFFHICRASNASALAARREATDREGFDAGPNQPPALGGGGKPYGLGWLK